MDDSLLTKDKLVIVVLYLKIILINARYTLYADEFLLAVNPLMEKITEENSAVNDCTKLELSATIDDVGPRLSSVKTSFEFNRDISSIDGAPIQLEKKMEDGEFSGNKLHYIVKDTTVIIYVNTTL